MAVDVSMLRLIKIAATYRSRLVGSVMVFVGQINK